MSLFRLQINSSQYTFSDILAWNDVHEDPFVLEVLQLCKQWLSGEEVFTTHTSGSTGTPKIIEITRTQIISSARKSLSFFGLKPGDAILCPLSMKVVGGKMMLFRSLIGGLQLHVIRPDRSLSEMSTTVYYDFMPITSLQLYELLTHHTSKIPALNNLTHLLIGGGALSAELTALIERSLTCTVWQSYGMTETVSHIALRKVVPATEHSYTVLKDILIDTDERGCLKIKGDVTNDVWVQTNDTVEIIDASHFRFVGRADFVINSGGIKIQAEALEHSIRAIFQKHLIQHSFFIAGIKDAEYVEKLIILLDGNAFPAEESEKILLLLKNNLPKHQAPKDLYAVPFIYTASGKVNRMEILRQVAL